MDTHQPPTIRTVIRFGALHNEATSYRPGDDPVELDLTAARDKGKLSAIAAALCDVHGLGSVRDRNEVAKRSIERTKVKSKQRKPERGEKVYLGNGVTVDREKYVDMAEKMLDTGKMPPPVKPREASVTKTKLHLPMGA